MGNMATKQAALRSVFRGQLVVAAIVLAFSGAAAGDQTPAQATQAGPGGKIANNLLWLKPSDAKACPVGTVPVTNAQGAVATENGKTKCVPATNSADREH
jgi:hypothetical protein